MYRCKMKEIFYDYDEALECKQLHDGEITFYRGHPVYMSGEMVYVIPEDKPHWVVQWDEID